GSAKVASELLISLAASSRLEHGDHLPSGRAAVGASSRRSRGLWLSRAAAPFAANGPGDQRARFVTNCHRARAVHARPAEPSAGSGLARPVKSSAGSEADACESPSQSGVAHGQGRCADISYADGKWVRASPENLDPFDSPWAQSKLRMGPSPSTNFIKNPRF
ncbi:hypothetical protein Dimus_007740, partial [Dionaea muscipula]